MLSGCAVLYGLYRSYYALGGTAGMVGGPASHQQWLMINAFAAIGLLVAATVPLAALPLSSRRHLRLALVVLFSLAAVGLVMHALIDETQRVLSLTGLAAKWRIPLAAYSMTGWTWKDQRAADLQDMLLNEPWFLLEGILCGAIVWLALDRPDLRRWWLTGALAAVVALTGYGVLSAVGIVGRTIVF